MSPLKKDAVRLAAQERTELARFVASGRKSARELTRGRIVLRADRDQPARVMRETLGVTRRTVPRMRQCFANRGAAEPGLSRLRDQPRSGRPIEMEARGQAQAAMVAGSVPPDGAAKWTLRLLADRLVEWEIVESISQAGVRMALPKTGGNRGYANKGVSVRSPAIIYGTGRTC